MRQALFISKRGFKGQSTTLEAYNRDLGYLGDWLEKKGLKIFEMTDDHWPEYVEYRNRGDHSFQYKAQRRALSGARRWLREIAKITTHPIFDVEWPQGVRKPQRTLKLSQRDKLLEEAKNTQKPERNTALIRALWDLGGREFEIADALWENVDLETRMIWLLTKAEDLKPRQWEQKRFGPRTAAALVLWQAQCDGDARIFGLTNNGISSVFKRFSVKVGFKVSPHDFRRGIGTYMAENGVSDRLAMKQLGLKHHGTYQRYSEAADLKALDGVIW